MATKIKADGLMDLHFAKSGLDVSAPFGKQPARRMTNGDYARTTPVGVNVRTYEPTKNRNRGGSRCGLIKYIAGLVSDSLGGTDHWIIQDVNTLVTVGIDPPGGGSVETNQSGRLVNLLAVSQGVVKVAQAGDATWTATTNNTGNTPPLNLDGVMFSTQCNQKLFFADGTNYVYYDPTDNSVNTWTASAGTLPVDTDSNTPRLICTWRGRVVLSGLIMDPQNWFMSRKDNPFDFDYGAAANDPSIAVAGNNSPAGTVGDVVTGLIPYTDDVLIMLCDHSIWLFNGDPQAGGQIDLVSDTIGGAFGKAWCKGPLGQVFFYSSRNGIFRMVPGKEMTRISDPIQKTLDSVVIGETSIRMEWDERNQGFHTFLTPLASPQSTFHLFYEDRAGAWWQDTFSDMTMNPLCSAVMDGNEPNDRVVLIGSWSGYVRAFDPDAVKDDGVNIASSVVIGPLLSDNLDEILLKSLQGVLGAESGDITFDILVGFTAEQALASEPVLSGTWKAGRNLTSFIRRAGHALYVRLSSTNRWSFESMRAELVTQGRVRMRGR